MQILDFILIIPGLIYVLAFFLISQAEGDASRGYTLFGSETLGNILFLVMVSSMVFGLPAVCTMLYGIYRVVRRRRKSSGS